MVVFLQFLKRFFQGGRRADFSIGPGAYWASNQGFTGALKAKTGYTSIQKRKLEQRHPISCLSLTHVQRFFPWEWSLKLKKNQISDIFVMGLLYLEICEHANLDFPRSSIPQAIGWCSDTKARGWFFFFAISPFVCLCVQVDWLLINDNLSRCLNFDSIDFQSRLQYSSYFLQ